MIKETIEKLAAIIEPIYLESAARGLEKLEIVSSGLIKDIAIHDTRAVSFIVDKGLHTHKLEFKSVELFTGFALMFDLSPILTEKE
jgi:hypothetical protein